MKAASTDARRRVAEILKTQLEETLGRNISTWEEKNMLGRVPGLAGEQLEECFRNNTGNEAAKELV